MFKIMVRYTLGQRTLLAWSPNR